MAVRDEFDKRVKEVNSFYEILEIIELENPQIKAYDITSIEERVIYFSSSKVDILRSTAYLLLYNLIESTVYNSIVLIFDKINDENLKYFDIIEEVQKYWLNSIYKHDEKKKKETIIQTIMEVAIQIFQNAIALPSTEINYGGSLDARAIFSTASLMNIEVGNIRRIYSETSHGSSLSDIKKKRNWLAHGEKTFIEVGSTSSLSELVETKNNVFQFMMAYIDSVEVYIDSKSYKRL
jgi:hypothetical protein